MGRVVLGSGKISIENTDERVTRKVLQAMIDNHHMATFLPGALWLKVPTPLARTYRTLPCQHNACSVVHPEAVLKELMIHGAVELDC